VVVSEGVQQGGRVGYVLVTDVLLGQEVVQLMGELAGGMGVVGRVAAPDEIS